MRICADRDKRIGAYKITCILGRDYGVHVSVGRVYRLMNTMRLPSLSTDKPHYRTSNQDDGTYHNRPDQRFNQKSPNLIRISDITYLKAAGKCYYLRIVMDLFPRKVVPRELSPKADSELEIRTFRKACSLRGCQNGLMFTLRQRHAVYVLYL